jgi:hypothetical protein
MDVSFWRVGAVLRRESASVSPDLPAERDKFFVGQDPLCAINGAVKNLRVADVVFPVPADRNYVIERGGLRCKEPTS